MTDNEPSDPWLQQKGEQMKSYFLFTEFRDLGPHRALEKVITKVTADAKACEKDPSTPKENVPEIPTMSSVANLSSRWKWIERCKAWDEHLDEVSRTEQELAVKKMTKRHASDSEFLQGIMLDMVKDNEDFKLLSPTQQAWALNSITHSYSKLAMLERLSRGQASEEGESNKKGLSDFARTIESSIEKAKKEK